jgi:hypothetical protein
MTIDEMNNCVCSVGWFQDPPCFAAKEQDNDHDRYGEREWSVVKTELCRCLHRHVARQICVRTPCAVEHVTEDNNTCNNGNDRATKRDCILMIGEELMFQMSLINYAAAVEEIVCICHWKRSLARRWRIR